LTVRDHLVLAHRAHSTPHRLWRDMLDPRSLFPPSRAESERVDGLLELLKLTRVAAAPVAALPLGIVRLVEVGRALAGDPRVVLLDEPLSGLDINGTANLLSVFRTIVAQSERGLSLVIVEHDIASVLALAESVVVLDFGECIATGTPDQIRHDPAVRSAYLGDAEMLERRVSSQASADGANGATGQGSRS
jgi:ABC-type branched-subunit amino acid transport system ATPase component